MTHHLKTWPSFFVDVQRGIKTFEVRKDDREFSVGDILILQEFDPMSKKYTGFELSRSIIYKLNGGYFGIEAGYCILGIKPLNRRSVGEYEHKKHP